MAQSGGRASRRAELLRAQKSLRDGVYVELGLVLPKSNLNQSEKVPAQQVTRDGDRREPYV